MASARIAFAISLNSGSRGAGKGDAATVGEAVEVMSKECGQNGASRMIRTLPLRCHNVNPPCCVHPGDRHYLRAEPQIWLISRESQPIDGCFPRRVRLSVAGLGRAQDMGKLTKIAEAADRLERAILRLEAAMEQTELPMVRPDLQAALSSAKSQYAILARTTQTVASRLDGAILRLDRVLEE